MERVIKLETKKAFCLENTKNDNIVFGEDKKHYRNTNICRFCEKIFESDKIRDHRQLTGNYSVPGHNKCNFNVSQKESSFTPFAFHNFSKYDCHLFFKKLVVKKNAEVKFDTRSKTKRNVYQ